MNVFFFVAAVCVGVSLAFLTAFFVVSGCVGFLSQKVVRPIQLYSKDLPDDLRSARRVEGKFHAMILFQRPIPHLSTRSHRE